MQERNCYVAQLHRAAEKEGERNLFSLHIFRKRKKILFQTSEYYAQQLALMTKSSPTSN